MVKPVKPKNPKSLIWDYFDDANDGEHAVCKICAEKSKNKKYKINDGETSSLRSHVQACHGVEWLDVMTEEKRKNAEKLDHAAKRSKIEDPQQPSIKKAFSNLTLVNPQGAIQKKYDRLLLELIGCNFLPFSLVDSSEFHSFIRNLDKSINLKTSRTYSRQMDEYCKELLDEVKKMITDHCDCSMAINTDSFISITTHFIDKQFRIHRWTPACKLFEGRHTGDNIQEVLDSILTEDLKVSDSLPKFGTSDNAANMIKALDQSSANMYGCNNHTQQLAILDAFKDFKSEEFMEEITMLDSSDACKKLAEFVHKSPLAKMMLTSECEETGHSPKAIPQANDTRWDSRCSNMEGTLYHEECLMRLARKGKFTKRIDGHTVSMIPSITNFRMIKGGVEVLKICRETTKLFEQEKVPTLPLVVERLYNMDKDLESFINDDENREEQMSIDFAEVLRAKLNERFPEFGTDRELNCIANYLNPSIKGVHLKLIKKLQGTKILMEEKLKLWRVDTEETVIVDENEEDTAPVVKMSPTDLLKQQLKNVANPDLEVGRGRRNRRGSRSELFTVPLSELDKECQRYELLPDSDSDANMLEWWKVHSNIFPLLSHLVRTVFPVPAASSKSERVFSVAGNFVRPQRNRMEGETVENLVTMKCNLELLKEMGLRK